jgi:hypothetical protein
MPSCAGGRWALADDFVDGRYQRVQALRALGLKFRYAIEALVEAIHALSEALQLVVQHHLGCKQAPVFFFEFEMTVEQDFNQTLQAIQPVRVMSIVGHANPFYRA